MNKTTKVRVVNGKAAKARAKRTSDSSPIDSASISEAAMLRMADYMSRTENMHANWIKEYKNAIFTGVLAGSKSRKLKLDPTCKLSRVKSGSQNQVIAQKESA